MVQRNGGFRSGTRSLLRKSVRTKGKLSLRKYFQDINEGAKVQLVAEPAYQKGMFLPRFAGKIGTVQGRQGDCYKVLIKDHNKAKELIVHPVHLSVK
ncbi:50S ribosomal protein L21e [Nanoarchaeota archaeon]